MRRVRVAKAARAHAVRDCLSDRSSRRCALGHLGPFALGGPEPEAVPAPPPPLLSRSRAGGGLGSLLVRCDTCKAERTLAGITAPGSLAQLNRLVAEYSPGNLRGPTWRARRHQRSCSAAPATSTSPTYARRRHPSRSKFNEDDELAHDIMSSAEFEVVVGSPRGPIAAHPIQALAGDHEVAASEIEALVRAEVRRRAGMPSPVGAEDIEARNGWPSRRLMPRRTMGIGSSRSTSTCRTVLSMAIRGSRCSVRSTASSGRSGPGSPRVDGLLANRAERPSRSARPRSGSRLAARSGGLRGRRLPRIRRGGSQALGARSRGRPRSGPADRRDTAFQRQWLPDVSARSVLLHTWPTC